MDRFLARQVPACQPSCVTALNPTTAGRAPGLYRWANSYSARAAPSLVRALRGARALLFATCTTLAGATNRDDSEHQGRAFWVLLLGIIVSGNYARFSSRQQEFVTPRHWRRPGDLKAFRPARSERLFLCAIGISQVALRRSIESPICVDQIHGAPEGRRVEPSVGSVGDSYDNALAETINDSTKPK